MRHNDKPWMDDLPLLHQLIRAEHATGAVQDEAREAELEDLYERRSQLMWQTGVAERRA